jgi:predicted dehydrogenase
LRTVVTRGGLDAVVVARRFGAEQATTDLDAVLSDPQVDAVVIATPHASHAKLAIAALRAGKHVFVEKPLALRLSELDAIAAAHAQVPDRVLFVGFNRRFAPLTVKLRTLLAEIREPKSVLMTVNAGALPAGHWVGNWVGNTEVSGGRVIGEGCHFVDLMLDLIGASPVGVAGAAVAGGPARLSGVLGFADGSTGTLHYLDQGHASFPKERIEVFTAGRIYRIDNFQRLEGFGVPGFKPVTLRHMDKGNDACVAAFVDSIKRGGAPAMTVDSVLASSRATLELAAATGQGQ